VRTSAIARERLVPAETVKKTTKGNPVLVKKNRKTLRQGTRQLLV